MSYLIVPGERSFILGPLMAAPLIVLLAPIITRGADRDGGAPDDMGAGGMFGPP